MSAERRLAKRAFALALATRADSLKHTRTLILHAAAARLLASRRLSINFSLYAALAPTAV